MLYILNVIVENIFKTYHPAPGNEAIKSQCKEDKLQNVDRTK